MEGLNRAFTLVAFFAFEGVHKVHVPSHLLNASLKRTYRSPFPWKNSTGTILAMPTILSNFAEIPPSSCNSIFYIWA